jgi:hypothetical protein
MEELIHDFKNGKFNLLHPTAVEKLLEKYLDKEKDQIIHAWNDGNFIGRNGWIIGSPIEYYKETYGKERQEEKH